MSLSLVTAPAGEPLSLDTVKSHLRLDVDNEDARIVDVLIPAARERGELATRRAWMTQTWDLTFYGFPGWCDLPKPPLVSVSWVKYYDTDGVLQTLATDQYDIDAPAGPRCRRGRITPAYNVTWPTTRDRSGAVTVRFVAGYGTAVAVPAMLKAAMLMDIGTLFEQRADVVTGTIVAALPQNAKAIYWSYRSHGCEGP